MALDPREHERRYAERLAPGTPPQAAAALAAAFQPSLVAYGQAPALAAAILRPPAAAPELAAAAVAGAPQLSVFRELRASAADWLPLAAALELLRAYRVWGKGTGYAARDLLMPLRIALTAAEHGPELPFVLAALHRDETLRRLDATLAGKAAGEPTTTPGDAS
jgi:glutamyl/glutaminyl-tRNA synthetase